MFLGSSVLDKAQLFSEIEKLISKRINISKDEGLVTINFFSIKKLLSNKNT
jgi:hypothetical protein